MDELTKAEFERVHDEDGRQNRRIEILESKVELLNDVTLSIKELTINMRHMVEAQTQMKEDLEEIKAKPAENWNKAVWIIITLIIGAVVGYAFHAIGLE